MYNLIEFRSKLFKLIDKSKKVKCFSFNLYFTQYLLIILSFSYLSIDNNQEDQNSS